MIGWFWRLGAVGFAIASLVFRATTEGSSVETIMALLFSIGCLCVACTFYEGDKA